MTTQTLQKLNSLDFTDGNSVRSLFQELRQLFDNQKDEITKLRIDYDELKNEKDELGKSIPQVERYSSYMCLTFHGIRDGDEYPVHTIVEIIRSVNIPIEPCDIAACHYLPGDWRNKNQLLLNFFTIINVIKFGNNVILFLIPKQRQLFMSTKGLLKMIATFRTTVEKKNTSKQLLTKIKYEWRFRNMIKHGTRWTAVYKLMLLGSKWSPQASSLSETWNIIPLTK